VCRRLEYIHVVAAQAVSTMHKLLLLVNQIAQVGNMFDLFFLNLLSVCEERDCKQG
jgi:adenylylsulfate kinase-like enzyme